MKITLLGTGGALLDPDRGHTSVLVEEGGRSYVMDMGTGATRSMIGAFVDPLSVEAVLLTHLHFDHTADLPVFFLGSWMSDRDTAPAVFGPAGTREMIASMFEGGVFDVDIRARASYPQRQRNIAVLRPQVTIYDAGLVMEDDRVRITALKVDHIPDDVCKCYAFKVESENRTVVFSGDTAPVSGMADFARGADLLIHEATFPEEAIAFRAKNGIGTYSHTSPTQLGAIARDAGVKLLVATHIGHWDSTNPIVRRLASKHLPVEIMSPALRDSVAADIARSYAGPVMIARDGLTIYV